MGLLDSLLSGNVPPQFSDYLQRYAQGAPQEGIGDEETAQHYQDVAGSLDPQTYQQAAHESFSRLDPQQREEFGQQLQGLAQQHGIDPNAYGPANETGSLAALAGALHQRSPGILGSLLGGGGVNPAATGLGGLLAGPGSGGSLGGLLGGGAGGGAGGGGNAIARAALGGIVAMAAKRLLANQGGTSSGGAGGLGGLGGLLGSL